MPVLCRTRISSPYKDNASASSFFKHRTDTRIMKASHHPIEVWPQNQRSLSIVLNLAEQTFEIDRFGIVIITARL
jgi:hypothetical protein